MNTLNFTFNFHAPVGQNIAHVDHLEAHFDKDMTMQVIDGASPHPSPKERGCRHRWMPCSPRRLPRRGGLMHRSIQRGWPVPWRLRNPFSGRRAPGRWSTASVAITWA